MVKPASQRARRANQQLHPHHIRRKTAAVAVAACFTTGVALANPTTPTVVSGTVSMSQAGSILNITNSHNAIINWGSFSIGVNELTRFIQPSALSAVLNRVVGQDPSAILGALQSNGRVFLINPNGIVFGSGAQINVAGLVASTLNISNDDFLNNRMRFTDGAGAGSVVNQGSITGGSVYLIGNAVANNGLITSPNGEVVLAAGNSVELVNPGTPNLRVEVVASANEARNLGTISAEAGRIGIYAGLVKQGGTISADSAVAEGGRIMLKSTKSTMLEAGSVTTARGTSGGEIIALSGMTDGKTEVAGKLDASAIASGTPGAGGFIETSAAKVKIADSALITAAGSGSGKAGTWLIDPADFYISNAYGGDMSATLLSSMLGAYGSGTNVDVMSTSGLTGSSGTIFVNDAVTWSTDSTLRLIAVGNVDVNSAITNTGNGAVKLYAGWTEAFDGSSNPIVGFTAAPTRIINLNAPISTLGDIHLIAHGNVVQGAPGSLTANGLLASSTTGSVNLANASATNTVNTVAGGAIGQFAFKNTGNLTIGSVGGVSGITAYGGNPGLHVTVDVGVTGGALTVSNPIVAVGMDGSEGQAGGNANISLTAANGITVNSNITANAGHGGYGSFGSPGGGGAATINLTNTGASSAVVIGNGVLVQAIGGGGGDSYGAYGGAFDGARGGDAVVSLTSAGSITVEGQVRGVGGHGGSGSSGVGGRGGDGIVNIVANGGDLTIAAYGGVIGSGGSGGYGRYGEGGRGGDAIVNLTASGGLIVASGGYVEANGGGGSEGSDGAGGRGGDAVINLVAGGDMTIAGSVYAWGGDGHYGYYGDGGRGGDATVNLSATNNISISGSVFAGGGSGSSANYVGAGGRGGDAIINVSAGSGITVTGTVSAEGGWGSSGSNGAGGRGGDATINLTAGGDLTLNSASSSAIRADGGEGGDGYWSGDGGRGGNATINLTSGGMLTVSGTSDAVYARGREGGYIDGGEGFSGGRGGDGTIQLTSAGGIRVFSNVRAEGGYRGGTSASFGSDIVGNGGNATIAFNNTSANLIDISGASVLANGGDGVVGGNASISMTSAGGIALGAFDEIRAAGGTGEAMGTMGQGGTASIVLTNTNAGAGIGLDFLSSINARGGNMNRSASGSGNAGDAVIILSSAGGITLSGAYVTSSGGNISGSGSGAVRGGHAALTMLAGGNILIEGGEGAAWGGSGPVGGNAAVNVIAGGNIQIEGGEAFYNLMAYSYGPSAQNSVVASAAGSLNLFSGASVYTSGLAGLGGANITIDDSSVWGGTGVQADASGSLSVVNFGELAGGGIANITTGGNVLVETNGLIAGFPDVVMKVGGEIFINTGGRIEAGMPSTIYLTFPMLASGGYTVNGIPGLVFDGSTGFFAGGSGAILNTNLLVTYGGGAELVVPTDTLIVAMSDSIKPPDAEKKKDIFEDEKDLKKKRESPVCR